MEPTIEVPEPANSTLSSQPISGILSRFWRGRREDPSWVRPALLTILIGTAILYLWDLSASGWANAYYSMAVQAASVNWKAFFFGSLDAANAITVDKTPGSIWLMALSVRLFGLNSWAILAPQALLGVSTVGLVYLTVRRSFSPAAGLIAAGVTATTPVAVLMFRFNNPDALLTLSMVAAAYAMVRAQENAETRWLVLAGILVGFGFLTKMLQVSLVVPVFGLFYLVAAPTSFWRRLWQGLLALGSTLVTSGWWVALVELWPVASRPYIGGSQANNLFDLMLGYNGFGRINGDEIGSVIAGGGQGNAGAWGQTGLFRMFGYEVGTQISWLIPAALIMFLAGLWWTRNTKRTHSLRASYLLWGGWLMATGLVFSFMHGIFHPYYTVALAPPIGALVGMGVVQAWENHRRLTSRIILAIMVAITTCWSWVLLSRTPNWQPWLRPALFFLGIIAVLVLLVLDQFHGWSAIGVITLALIVCLAGPTAYAVATAATPHTGAIPTAGPPGAVSNRFGRGGPGFGFPNNPNFGGPVIGGLNGGGFGFPRAGGPGALGASPLLGAPGQDGRAGGLLEASQPGSAIQTLLLQDADQYTWVAATVGANSAAGFQLATQEPVMSIGGFNGTDPWPSLEQFQDWVNLGQIHYFISSGRGFGGNRATGGEIEAWVAVNFPSITVEGITLYDLTLTK